MYIKMCRQLIELCFLLLEKINKVTCQYLKTKGHNEVGLEICDEKECFFLVVLNKNALFFHETQSVPKNAFW